MARTSTRAAACFMWVAFLAGAQARDFTGGAARVGRDALRYDEAAEGFAIKRAPEAGKPSVELRLGFAYEADEDGANGLTTPFAWDWISADNTNRLQIRGDGYSRQRSPDGTRRGLANVGIRLSHNFGDFAQGKFVGAIGLVIPSHGEVGSSAAAQTISASYSRKLSPTWRTVGVAFLAHSNRHLPGISQYTKGGHAELDYAVDGDRGFILGLDRRYTSGAGGSTDLGIEYDFPLSGKLAAELSVSRGLTSGARSTAIDFTIVYPF